MSAEVIAFVSGKGGTGKSTVTVHLGAALASQGHRVLVVEVNNAFRSVDTIAGVSSQAVFDLQDICCGRTLPEDALLSSPLQEALYVIPAPYEGGRVTPEALHSLTERLKDRFDYILLDTASGLVKPFKAALQVAHRVVFVITPDPPALRAGRLLVDRLTAGQEQARVIFNRVDKERILHEEALPDLDEAIDAIGVQLLGLVPESLPLQSAAAAGAPLGPYSQEKKIFTVIARRIAGEDLPLLVR